MIEATCIICGGALPERPKGKRGPSSPCCSVACRQQRKRNTANSLRAVDPERFRAKERARYAADLERTRDRKRRKYRRNIEHYRTYARESVARRREDPETRRKLNESSRESYWRNRDERVAAMRAAYAANPEEARAQAMRYYYEDRESNLEAHRAKRRIKAANRRARLADVFVESVDPLEVYQRGGGICGICEASIEPSERWHVDHIIPIARGGEHSYANTQPAHAFCNISKGARLPEAA